MFGLPTTATAPFCPSEVRGSVVIPSQAPLWKRLLKVAGPGLLVSVGYMDPGNWATDIEAGSRFGPALLWVVLASSLAAMLLQALALRLGLATGLDLAQACRQRYSRPVNLMLWLMAELAIIACDVAEVLGTALALHLLFGISLQAGVALTALDTLFVLGLKGRGFRQVEAIVLGLVATIGVCFLIQILLVGPHWPSVMAGFVPGGLAFHDPKALMLAVGILGATVMPHNLYLHSSIVQTRHVASGEAARREAIRLSTYDTVISLTLALLVNAAILVLAASAFHANGHKEVTEIQEAYHLLDPLVGTAGASLLFGLALLASGQSSTFTGTIAGQVIMEGFLQLKIPCWQRRLATRALALLPAWAGVAALGEAGVGPMLVGSQVVLSLQLPFAIWPLLRMNGDTRLMGRLAAPAAVRAAGWLLLALICLANAALLRNLLAG
ncbi:Nramp family divalent metal transporter [Paucibacter sp. R3-3]|uniref:Divalent metal cation transporter MntH n=1 Tax=Roseateles agri TaxID=3098619 RepID=A0ABU5DM56_9BURK|nr:Nramp family divalent metal transporter [Paucibacter sp. R3-3]MDY0747383.1 Nramp family divalent metal transporter [Paucibacter sp. R3-3]